ncbi:BRO family protein [Novosphingobium sp. KCTC 2891]|uniref:BRO-N domain-containing protein n=1 Tax=Novosphingobium sp. KCTC 2891 TaxID=2989730 RepID=UPI0022239151|nr:BRO family protein [Novosphingobium sp. KCTC 2891]MCW1382690.1 BRO family protein [Novosphingobium sp. KCTC 2891]
MNTFDFNGHRLRTIDLDGEPWFHATDVCKCIGLNTAGGAGKHLTALTEDEKRTLNRTPGKIGGHDAFVGKTSAATTISESGLYKLILRANPSRPEVAEFQNWVTRDVLPSIRKTGGYLLNEDARTLHAWLAGCRRPVQSVA